jgi:ABC-type Mn2+/Zn2+ transport system ATPase subunit
MFSHLELLLFISVSVNILMETLISTLETKIGSKMMLYAFLILFNQCMSLSGLYINSSLSKVKMLEYKRSCLEKYERLDDVSKEKDTLESFNTKLEKSSMVIQLKYSWAVDVITSMMSCLSSLSFIFIVNNEYSLLLCFIFINILWMKFIILPGMDSLDKERSKERKNRYTIYEKLSLLMNRLYLGEADVNAIIKQDISLLDDRFKLDLAWVYLSLYQQVPNLLFIILISFIYFDENKLQMIVIVFIKIRNTVSNTSHFLNQWKTMQNDVKAIEDFFDNKTFCVRSIQIDIPDTLSFTSSIIRNTTKILTKPETQIIVNKGDVIVLSGVSGCGKTTLIKGMLGQIEGIIYDSGYPSDSYVSKIAYMRQNIREVTPMVKVTLRNLFSDDSDSNLIKKVLNYAKIYDWFENQMNGNLDIPIGELCTPSGGEKTRICFAMTLYRLEKNKCSWLILDEPEQGLDSELAPDMLTSAFEQYPDISIIMITHLCDCRMKTLNITHKWTIDKSGFLNSNLY